MKRLIASGSVILVLGAIGAVCAQDGGAGSAHWSAWRGDSTLCGVTHGTVEVPAEIRWKAKIGAPVTTTPVGGGGFVYALTSGGQVVKLDSRDGRTLWVRAVEPSAPVTNSQGASDGFVAPLMLSGSVLVSATMRGMVYGLETETGERRWSYDAGVPIQGSPVGVEGRGGAPAGVVVLGQVDGVLHCLDGQSGRLRWRGGAFGRVDGHPAAQGDCVVVGGCDAAIHVVRGDGTGVVSVATIAAGEGNEIAGGVAVNGSNAYHGSRSGVLFAADVQTRKHCWKRALGGGELHTTPAVNDVAVVCASGNGVISTVDRKTGDVKWKHDTRGDRVSSPIVVGDKVVCSVDGKIVIVRLSDGGLAWSSRDLGGEITAPAFIDGAIIVGTGDGFVVALGAGASAGKEVRR